MTRAISEQARAQEACRTARASRRIVLDVCAVYGKYRTSTPTVAKSRSSLSPLACPPVVALEDHVEPDLLPGLQLVRHRLDEHVVDETDTRTISSRSRAGSPVPPLACVAISSDTTPATRWSQLAPGVPEDIQVPDVEQVVDPGGVAHHRLHSAPRSRSYGRTSSPGCTGAAPAHHGRRAKPPGAAARGTWSSDRVRPGPRRSRRYHRVRGSPRGALTAAVTGELDGPGQRSGRRAPALGPAGAGGRVRVAGRRRLHRAGPARIPVHHDGLLLVVAEPRRLGERARAGQHVHPGPGPVLRRGGHPAAGAGPGDPGSGLDETPCGWPA